MLLVYNLTNGNLTFIGFNWNWGQIVELSNTHNIGDYVTKLTGSINVAFANLNNLREFMVEYYAPLLSGNINIFSNKYRLEFISIPTHDRYTEFYYNNISGDIAVFGDKYDLVGFIFMHRAAVYGELKSLKNLKKFYIFYCKYSGITGSKSDLYNQGANCIYFDI